MHPAKIGRKRRRLKTCANCKAEYVPRPNAQPFEKWCSVDCGVAISRAAVERQRRRRKQKEVQALRQRKEALKTPQQIRSDAMQKAEKAVRDYVRLRDAGKPCPSCLRSEREVESGPYSRGGYWDAGHFLSKGSHPELRLVALNIWRQCKLCNGGENRYRNSGKRESVRATYRETLVGILGEARVQQLEGPHKPLKADLEYLERVRAIFNKRARHIRRLRGD